MEGDLEREQNIFLLYRRFLPQLLAPLALVDVVVVGAGDSFTAPGGGKTSRFRGRCGRFTGFVPPVPGA